MGIPYHTDALHSISPMRRIGGLLKSTMSRAKNSKHYTGSLTLSCVIYTRWCSDSFLFYLA